LGGSAWWAPTSGASSPTPAAPSSTSPSGASPSYSSRPPPPTDDGRLPGISLFRSSTGSIALLQKPGTIVVVYMLAAAYNASSSNMHIDQTVLQLLCLSRPCRSCQAESVMFLTYGSAREQPFCWESEGENIYIS
jgi:hypothetical protein